MPACLSVACRAEPRNLSGPPWRYHSPALRGLIAGSITSSGVALPFEPTRLYQTTMLCARAASWIRLRFGTAATQRGRAVQPAFMMSRKRSAVVAGSTVTSLSSGGGGAFAVFQSEMTSAAPGDAASTPIAAPAIPAAQRPTVRFLMMTSLVQTRAGRPSRQEPSPTSCGGARPPSGRERQAGRGKWSRASRSAAALLRPCRLLLGALDGFLRTELREARDQRHRNGLRERKADRALADPVGCKFVLEGIGDATGGGIERVVLFPPGEIKYGIAAQFERGDLVTDHFLGAGHGLADGAADALQDCLHVFGLRRDVFVYGLEIGLGHRILARSAFNTNSAR